MVCSLSSSATLLFRYILVVVADVLDVDVDAVWKMRRSVVPYDDSLCRFSHVVADVVVCVVVVDVVAENESIA